MMSVEVAERRHSVEERFLRASERHWHPVLRSADLESGPVRSVTLLSRALAVWRAADRSVAVVDAVCAHRGADLSDGRLTSSGCLRCPYHGWEYGPDGRCTFVPQSPNAPIPARARVGSYRACEVAGLVWIWLAEEEPAGPPTVPESVRHGWRWVVWPSFTWEASAVREIENFSDMAHFSILHADTFGDTTRLNVDPYHVTTSPDGTVLEWEFDYTMVDRRQVPALTMPTHWVYRIRVPFVSSIDLYDAPTGELRRVFVNFAVPTTAYRTEIFYAAMFREGATEQEIDATFANSIAIFEEDRLVVERQRPCLLDLEASTDLQATFDRYSVAYRRALAQMSF